LHALNCPQRNSIPFESSGWHGKVRLECFSQSPQYLLSAVDVRDPQRKISPQFTNAQLQPSSCFTSEEVYSKPTTPIREHKLRSDNPQSQQPTRRQGTMCVRGGGTMQVLAHQAHVRHIILRISASCQRNHQSLRDWWWVDGLHLDLHQILHDHHGHDHRRHVYRHVHHDRRHEENLHHVQRVG